MAMIHDPVCVMELDPRNAKAVAEYKHPSCFVTALHWRVSP